MNLNATIRMNSSVKLEDPADSGNSHFTVNSHSVSIKRELDLAAQH